MAKISNVHGDVKLNAPSIPDQMMEDSNRIEREKDARGRIIGVKLIEWVDSFDVSCIVGPEISENNRAFGFALATCSVVEIDGEPVMRPQNKNHLRALMQRLGNAGMNAASKALDRLGGNKVEPGNSEAEEIKN
jgi:hypothetical protein